MPSIWCHGALMVQARPLTFTPAAILAFTIGSSRSTPEIKHRSGDATERLSNIWLAAPQLCSRYLYHLPSVKIFLLELAACNSKCAYQIAPLSAGCAIRPLSSRMLSSRTHSRNAQRKSGKLYLLQVSVVPGRSSQWQNNQIRG